jgi:hypothetical protein
MLSREPFRLELRAQIHEAIKRGARQLIVNSAELRRAVAGEPQADQMQCCRDAMREEMKPSDSIIEDCERGGLTIMYVLPTVVSSPAQRASTSR